MVCDNNGKRSLQIIERCYVLGIGVDRAHFLMSCSHNDTGRSKEGSVSDRGQSIPYDESVLVKEAFRLGIGFADTARMLGLSHEKLSSYGVPFKVRSKYPPPPGPNKIYNLFPPEPYDNQAH